MRVHGLSFICASLISTPELEEDGVRIALTIVDTPGFGDNIDNELSCVALVATPIPRLTFPQLPGDHELH